MSVDLAALLVDLDAETDDLIGIVTADGDLDQVLSRPTPALPWTVGDTIGHLWFFDREAHRAATDPEEFTAGLTALVDDVDGYMQRAGAAAGALGVRVLPSWRQERSALVAALAGVPADRKVPWYGPPMSAASAATARLMETWAHGQDVADALGVVRVPTDRLRHICHLGFRTRDFSYAVRGRRPPDGPVRLELTSPDGEPWTFGPDEAADVIAGSGLDFALLVTQRRLVEDLDLAITGPLAAEWAAIAQVFAGAPSITDPSRAGLAATR